MKFEHDFFAAGSYGKFEILPLPSTKKIMHKYGLGMKADRAGFYTYLKESESHPHLLREGKQGLVLSFALQPTDPHFYQLTNVSLPSLGRVYDFSNLGGSVARATQFLTEGERLSDDDLSGFLTPGNGLDVFFQECEDTVIANDPLGQKAFEGDKSDFIKAVMANDLFDQSDWVIVDHQGESKKICPVSLSPGVFGIMSIVINPEDDHASFESLIEKEFTISFESRSVFWRYHIVSRKSTDLRDFEIKNGSSEVLFGDVKDVVMANGKPAKLMESKNAIKLLEEYTSGFRLELKKYDVRMTDEGVMMRYNLPTPSIEKVRMKQESNTVKSYSDIYFYI